VVASRNRNPDNTFRGVAATLTELFGLTFCSLQQIKTVKMGWEGHVTCIEKGRDHLEDLGIDVRI
jgi:hypothetical protein